MTNIEFRLFFESLPQKKETNSKQPSKYEFASECTVAPAYLEAIALGKYPLTAKMSQRLLPIMSKYGFKGE